MKRRSVVPKVSEQLEAGAVLVRKWGYEQTNVDFFVIADRKNELAFLQPMTAVKTPDEGLRMTGSAVPGEIDDQAPLMRKKIRIDRQTQQEIGFLFDRSLAVLWDGKPVRYSTYG